MARELVIPPIKGNPRIGRETENDASVRYGGAKLYHKTEAVIAKEKTPRKKRVAKKKSNQKNFLIKNLEILKTLSERLGISQSGVLNLGLAKVEKEFLK
jgi:hypothetical protein